jgi:SSS family solute:Na+ symporter
MIFGAIWIQQAETVTLQDTMTIAVSLLSGGLLGLYLFAFFVKQGDAKAVWIGVAATATFTAWTLLAKNGLLPESISVPFDLYYAGIIGNIVMFVVVFLAASLFSRRAKTVE